MEDQATPMNEAADEVPPFLAQPSQFHLGRVAHLSREERRRRQREKKSKKRNLPYKKPEKNAFPLSPTKSYSFQINMVLAGFPRSSVAAMTHLRKLMAPAPPDCKVLKMFQRTPEEIKGIHDAFMENIKARWAFRRLWLAYLLKKLKSVNQGIDPITLEPIQKKVSVCMLKTHAIYDFEAKSIAKTWTSNLLHNDGLFHEPRYPTNPFTNLSMNEFQVHCMIQGIRSASESNWVLESFSDCQYDLEKWKKKFSAPLRMECLKRVFSDIDNYDRFETILDFIELQHEYHGIDFNVKLFRWILTSPQTKEYADIWANECKKFYIEKYAINDKEDIENLEIKTSIQTAYLMEIPTVIKVLYNRYLEATNVSRRSSRRVQNRVISVRVLPGEGHLLGRPNI